MVPDLVDYGIVRILYPHEDPIGYLCQAHADYQYHTFPLCGDSDPNTHALQVNLLGLRIFGEGQ